MPSLSGDFLEELFDSIVPITHLTEKIPPGVDCDVARLDKIHPALSGNKLFKLWFYLEKYQQGNFQGLLTLGGPYSNHLLATAYACHRLGIPCTGIIRGEKPDQPGPTLKDCKEYGMTLLYVSREEYRKFTSTGYREPSGLIHSMGESHLVIPEGGAGEEGIRGASLIAGKIPGWEDYTHILCAAGTGTTLCGMDKALSPLQMAIGIMVVSIRQEDRAAFRNSMHLGDRSQILFDYAWGGYARQTPELLEFMRSFYQASGIPTDFVYTAKAVFALYDLLKQKYFPQGSRILLIHTGGLQGNRSLPPNLFGF